jgi:hypothetical protein
MATRRAGDGGQRLRQRTAFFGNNGANGTNWPTPMAPADDADEAMVFMAADKMNREADPMLTDPLNPTAPNFAPKAGSPALTGGATPPSDGFFDATATFVGAIGTEDWTAGWTSYPAPKAQ